MSAKVNVKDIIFGHIDTLKDEEGGVLKSDIFTFLLIPVLLSLAVLVFGFNLDKDLSSLLVNFGSIITALLLSVLVLVYDQKNKLREGKGESLLQEKRELLDELYYNISFSILCAISLVILCFVHTAFLGCFDFVNRIIITPVVVFLSLILVLTIVMIVKRMHALLITDE